MGAFCSRTLMPYDAEDLSVKLTAEDFDLKKGVEVAPEQRFEKPQFNDLWAAVLFVVHLGVTLLYGAGGFYFAMSDSDPTYTPDTYWESDYITIDLSDAFLCGVLLVVALSIGIVAAVVFYIVALKKPLVLIYFSYLTYFLMSMTMSVVILVTGIMVWSILLIILGSLFMAFSLLFCVCLFIARKTADITAAYLKISADILARFPAMLAVLLVSMVLYLIYSGFWMSVFVFSISYEIWVVVLPGTLWLLFSWYWTTQTIVGVVRCCVAGVVGYYYYGNSEDDMKSAVSRAFIRSVSTSLGSICFGTLITALLDTAIAFIGYLRILNATRGAKNLAQLAIRCITCIFLMCAQLCLMRISILMKWFNKYAFTFVGIYGLKFTESGYATMKLLVTNGLEVILNEANYNIVIQAQAFTIAAVTFLVNSALLGVIYYVHGSIDSTVWIAGEIIGIVLSLGVGMISTQLIGYCLPAILVCSAHEPSRMQNKTPELYTLLTTKYSNCILLRRANGEQI